MISNICWRGLAVDIIRRLWDRGLYQDNKILIQIYNNWLGFWIDYRAAKTMESVDQQLESMHEDPRVPDPLYWEEEEGETPLGGPLGYTYEFNDAPSGADPVQGPE